MANPLWDCPSTLYASTQHPKQKSTDKATSVGRTVQSMREDPGRKSKSRPFTGKTQGWIEVSEEMKIWEMWSWIDAIARWLNMERYNVWLEKQDEPSPIWNPSLQTRQWCKKSKLRQIQGFGYWERHWWWNLMASGRVVCWHHAGRSKSSSHVQTITYRYSCGLFEQWPHGIWWGSSPGQTWSWNMRTSQIHRSDVSSTTCKLSHQPQRSCRLQNVDVGFSLPPPSIFCLPRIG